MQLFDDKLIQDTIRSIQIPYQFNFHEENPFAINAVISNATFSPNSSYHIHSLEIFHCGDYTKISNPSDNIYMVTSDVLEQRGGKYKATLEYCNYSIPIYKLVQTIIGYDKLNRPIYDEVEMLVGNIPAILKYKDMTYSTNDAINLTKAMYEITIRNNDAAKEHFGLEAGTYNTVTIYDKPYRIVNVDYSKQGIIKLTLEKI